MGVAYLKFSDEAEAGHIQVEGGIEGAFDPNSAAHVTVMRLSQATDALNHLLMNLPPVQISLDGAGLATVDAANATTDAADSTPLDTPVSEATPSIDTATPAETAAQIPAPDVAPASVTGLVSGDASAPATDSAAA